VAANHVKSGDPAQTNAPETPALLHWDGSAWTTTELLDAALVKLTSIWGSASDDVWVVGTGAYVAHYDGDRWSRSFIPTASPTELDSVWGTGRADVWIGGFGMFHFDGQTWSERDADLQYPVSSVWTAPGDLWAVSRGLPRQSQDAGNSWYPAAPKLDPSSPPPSYTWRALWSGRDEAPFIAGEDGALGRWTDAGWVLESLAGESSSLDFTALYGLSSADVWGVGERGALAHWDGTRWAQGSSPTQNALRGVWGAGGRYFAVGDQGTFLELDDDASISNQPNAHELDAIWGGAPDDVWAVGKESIHWDGTSWAKVEALSDVELSGVWGSAPSDVWATGKGGALLHFDGSEWARVLGPTTDDLTGIWGSATDDVWAVAAGGEILHFDGQAWTQWPTENFGPLAAVYGNQAADVVAVGWDTRVHFDGHAWARLPNHPSEDPDYVSAFGDGRNVFIGGMVHWTAYKAGGANPELGRWDGSSIFDNLEPTWGGNAVVECGWANGLADVWLGLPTLAHWDGTSWTKAALSDAAQVGVSALGATSEDIWAAATNGQMLRKRRN
jgi:hypothetical protein